MGADAPKVPSQRQRKEDLSRLKTPPPDAGGGFDVKPSHVYYTAHRVAEGQDGFDKEADSLLTQLDPHQQAAGNGEGANAFAEAYKDVAERFFEVWAKSVVSIGGVAVGLTETANNYVAADWFSNQKQHGPPPRQLPPGVIRTAPSYGPVTTLKWTGTGDDGSDFAAAMGEIPDFLADVIRPAIEYGLNLGRTHEITPGADEDALTSIATAWRDMGAATRKAAKGFTHDIDYLTDNGNSDWQGAMSTFCQSIWGASAWGTKRGALDRDWRTNPSVSPRGRRPIIDVLYDTTHAVEKGCEDVRDAANKCRSITTQLAQNAAKAMVKDLTTGLSLMEALRLTATAAFGELVMTFRSHMDRAAADAAVEAYHKACHDAANELRKELAELDEAYLSAPTFRSEVARAQAFGSRSLHEFKNEHVWTVPNDAASNHQFPIDLANSEWLSGSHTIDKHVGKTDEQLVQRLRDDLKGPVRPDSSWPYGKPRIGSSSTFPDQESAQSLTQYCIDRNEDKIQEWLDGPPSEGRREEFTVSNTPDGSPSGRAALKHDYKTDGMNTPVNDVYGVTVRLKYSPDLNPPFTVETSVPSPPK